MNNPRWLPGRVLAPLRRALMGVALAACITPGQQRVELLSRSAQEFNADLRWGRFETAASSLPPDEARRFLARVDLLEKDLVMADFEVTQIKLGDPTTSATVLVAFEWYQHSDPVIRRTVVEQKWEHQGGAWMVIEQRRLRGERFPLIPDAPEPQQTPDAGAAGGG